MERDFNFEVKSLSEAGSFEGLASTYGNVDDGGDRIAPGAFTRTLAERGSEIPVLWSHDQASPIGLGVLTDSADGLRIKGKLDLDVVAGKEAYSRLRKRIVKGLSIGYRAVDHVMDRGIRVLKSIDLFEVSLVAVPMNPRAQVASVKSAIDSLRGFEQFLHQAGWSRAESKRLSSSGWAGLAGGDVGDEEDDGQLLAWLRSRNARGARR